MPASQAFVKYRKEVYAMDEIIMIGDPDRQLFYL